MVLPIDHGDPVRPCLGVAATASGGALGVDGALKHHLFSRRVGSDG